MRKLTKCHIVFAAHQYSINSEMLGGNTVVNEIYLVMSCKKVFSISVLLALLFLFLIYRSTMTTKIIVTFFLFALSTWTTKSEEMKEKKANFQLNNTTFWKFQVNAIKKSVKVPQLVSKISRLAERVSCLNIFSGAWNPYNY